MVATFLNILLIIAGFGVLIFVHELGHFLAAKWAGIRTEAFAIGMMHPVLAWRKGIGFRFGSTLPEYQRQVAEYLAPVADVNIKFKKKVTSPNDPNSEQRNRAEKALGLGETEYSLRWLPIGGFVKMLGQEDANPSAVSDDPRSYTRCPVGKRMIVVSAGVIANLLFAVALFIVVFMVGVKLEAPVLGDIDPSQPAAAAVALNALEAGVSEPGLQPGDEVTHIDGEPAATFADIQIAAAMGRSGVAIEFTVRRNGVNQALRFPIVPAKDALTGLLSIGVAPASSNILFDRDDSGVIAGILKESALAAAGVQPGMRLVRAGGEGVETFEQFERVVARSDGQDVPTEWEAASASAAAPATTIKAIVPVQPRYQILHYPEEDADEIQYYEVGLLGMTPLVKLAAVQRGPNQDRLRVGDVVLRIESIDGPRLADFRREIAQHANGEVELVVLRGGEELSLSAKVDRDGHLNVLPNLAWDLPLVSEPMSRVRTSAADEDGVATPFAELGLFGRTRIDAIGEEPIHDWADIRRELRAQTQNAAESGLAAQVSLSITHPTQGRDRDTLTLVLTADDVAALHALSWETALHPAIFEPLYTIRDAEGSPLRAVTMGFEETKKLILLTYLTIDRLFRGSVGVEQLHGPVGIVHIGTKVIDRGMVWLLFFLAMISVNLAVINFLPMPIVDGGLFLFLIYEKFKGRPPSLAFQNLANLVGLCLIGAIFLVTFYNDIARLIG